MGMISEEAAKASGLPIESGNSSLSQPGAPGPVTTSTDDADFAAAKAAFSSAMGFKQPEAAPPAAPAAAPAAASAPEAAPAAQPEPAPASELAAVLSRLTTLESDREAARAERDKLQAELAEARKQASLAEKLRIDPVGAMKEAGLTFDQVQDLLINGSESKLAKASETSETKRQLDEMKRQLEEVLAERSRTQAERERAQAVQQYRDTVIKPELTKAPLLVQAYGDAAIDQVFAMAQDIFTKTGKEPPIDQVVAGAERNLAALRDRLGVKPAPAPAPSLSGLQSASTTSSKAPAVDDDAALEAAATLLKQLRGR